MHQDVLSVPLVPDGAVRLRVDGGRRVFCGRVRYRMCQTVYGYHARQPSHTFHTAILHLSKHKKARNT